MTGKSQSFGNRVIRGSFWVIALEISNQFLQLFKTFFAAKILMPADFGIIGLAFLIIAIVDVLSTTGMKEAIIQRRDESQSYLSTVWIIELLKGVIILLLTLVVSYFIVESDVSSELTSKAVIFIGVIFFLQCITNTGVVYFEKQIQFRNFFLYQFSGTIVDVVVSTILVYINRDVWSLFYGFVSGNLVRVIFSFLLADHRAGFSFSYAKAKELLNFGKWIFGSRFFNFLGLQSDSLIVSSFFSLYSLGVYQMAFRIGNLPMSQVSNVIGRLAFPTFSKFQTDLKKVKGYFLMSLNFLSILLIPLVILIFSLVYEFTTLFLGRKWVDIVPVVKILVLSGFLRILISLVDSLFSALGHPKYSSRLQLTRFFIFIIIVYPLGYEWGIAGIAFSGLISLLTVLILFLRKVATMLELTIMDLLRAIAYPVIYGLCIAIGLYTVKIFYDIDIISFFGTVFITLLVYLTLGIFINKYTSIKIFKSAIELIQTYRMNV